MKKKSFIPQTRVKNPEPKEKDDNWIIWAAWADRITFEEIKEKTGKNESQVIKIMRKNLKPGSFRLWRKRVHNTSIKHRKKFQLGRKKLREKIKITDISRIFVNMGPGKFTSLRISLSVAKALSLANSTVLIGFKSEDIINENYKNLSLIHI